MFDSSTLFSKKLAGANRRGWSAERGGCEHNVIMPSALYQNQPTQLVSDTGTRGSPGGSC
jgi:hypothetical protein